MAWVTIEDEQCKLFQKLFCDDNGDELGYIVRFYDNGPTYAWVMSAGRIGPISPLKPGNEVPTGSECDEAARKRVEQFVGYSPEQMNASR